MAGNDYPPPAYCGPGTLGYLPKNQFTPEQLERLVKAAEKIATAFELISNKYR